MSHATRERRRADPSGRVNRVVPHERRSTAPHASRRARNSVIPSPPCATSVPLSRQLPCPICAPHEHHLLPCDISGCTCDDVPVPGLT
jgi:hypothetical protein